MQEPAEVRESDLIYDWNAVEKRHSLSPNRKFTFFCETLRDGIQSPSVVDPDIADKIRMVELASDLGIEHIDIGLPGAGHRAVEDCTILAKHIRDNNLPIIVFSLDEPGGFRGILAGEGTFTIVS